MDVLPKETSINELTSLADSAQTLFSAAVMHLQKINGQKQRSATSNIVSSWFPFAPDARLESLQSSTH